MSHDARLLLTALKVVFRFDKQCALDDDVCKKLYCLNVRF